MTACICLYVLGSGSVYSGTKTFVGLGSPSTDWSVSANWSPSGIPTPSDTAIIPDMGTTPATYVIPTQDATARKIIIQNGGNLRFDVGGRTLTVRADFIIQSGGQCSWWSNGSATLRVGGNFINDGSFMAPTTPPTSGNGFRVVFYNNASHTISGSSPVQFYSLTINNNNSLTIDGTDVGVAGTLSPSGYSPTLINGGSFNGSGAPLPITLASFSAAAAGDGRSVIVSWTTLSETNNYGFTIERRAESASVYQTVAFVPTQGNGIVPHDYVYTEADVPVGRWYYRLVQTDLSGEATAYDDVLVAVGGATGVDDAVVATAFRLEQNYPNPFNPSTTISYRLGSAGPVSLTVYDALGREVTLLAGGHQEAGSHTVTWNAAGLASGVYIARLESSEGSMMVRMLLVK
ncbi:MAG: T9SS type A sorting domain-containing protein [Bacteroidota bacterium]